MKSVAIHMTGDLYESLVTMSQNDHCSLDKEITHLLLAHLREQEGDATRAQEGRPAPAALAMPPADHFAAKRASILASQARAGLREQVR